jgi:hypothetical protein
MSMHANRQHDHERGEVTGRQSESPTPPSENTRFHRLLVQSIAPVIFLFISIVTTCFAGNVFAKNGFISPYHVFLAFPWYRDVLLSHP